MDSGQPKESAFSVVPCGSSINLFFDAVDGPAVGILPSVVEFCITRDSQIQPG